MGLGLLLCLGLAACQKEAAPLPGAGLASGSSVPPALVLAANPLPVAPAPQSRAAVFKQVEEMTSLGRLMFFDPTLSGSGRLSCASCHSPQHAFGPPNALPVQLGGRDMRHFGPRAAPSLKYRQTTPPFTGHFFESDDEGDDSVDNGPTGGLTWDGRVDRGRDQVRIPLLSVDEMAAASPHEVVEKVKRAPYAPAFAKTFGLDIFANDKRAFEAILQAFEVFEESPTDFYPYSSKYDAYLAGRTRLTAAEQHGLELFNDERKGNCINCHRSMPAKDGTPPQFTDYGLIAIGVPRNRELPANRDPAFFDLGACGPTRRDLVGIDEFCGIFKTPTLRNVALRKTFFHNGQFHDLSEVVRFYVERDIHPEKWYPQRADGSVDIYDDLPARYRANLNREPPFDRQPGDPPALDEAEIRDVVAFLGTLTDGWQPPP